MFSLISLKLNNVLPKRGENKASLMVNLVPFDNRRRVVSWPSIRFDEPDMVIRELGLGIKLEKYLYSQRMVCIVALSTRQLTSPLVTPKYKLIKSVACIKEILFN